MITKEELAAQLDGIEFPPHLTITKDKRQLAKDSGLVIVYGYSDDLMEFEGAFRDQVDCFGGGTALVDLNGVVGRADGSDEAIADYVARKKAAHSIEAIWCKRGDYAWAYETAIPHATFTVKEGDELYCLGLVFSVADLGSEVAQ